jgi:hypothetical protein
VLAVGLVTGLSAGCSGSSHQSAPKAAASAPAAARSGPPVDALNLAVTAMTSLRSYGFRLNATQTQGSVTQLLGATGRVVNPDRIQALLSVSGQREQVIGIPQGQFQLLVAAPGKPATRWQRAKGSSLQPIPWPKVLGDLQHPTITRAPSGPNPGSIVTGTLSPQDAVAFGYPSSATVTSAQVVVTLDSAHRVNKLDLKLAGRSGQDEVTVSEVVALDGFDQQAAIVAPAGVS